jgi:hypothetical protein
MPISAPPQITVPFATSGLKNTIPATSNPVSGNAGYDQGFPAINMTPKTAGGIPPFGQDFNGIFYDVTLAIQYLEAGGSFPYNSTYATAIGGYPLGALISRSDGSGLWRNVSANNTTDPETFGAGWQPEGAGSSAITMTNANVTLTALQAARSIIVITGLLTANLNLIFPLYQKTWSVINLTTGAFTITCKTAAGGGVVAQQSSVSPIIGNGTDILAISDPDASETVKGILKLATQALTNARTNDLTAVTPLKLGNGFAFNNGANGYIQLPTWMGSFILQWGQTNVTAGIVAGVTFPTAFPTAFLSGGILTGQPTGNNTATLTQGIQSVPTTTGMNLINSSGTVIVRWVVVGY